jgi:eukaryotic-like serine/threonine-protein kinase
MGAEPRRTGDQALPRRIGRYEAFLQIGTGGTARVYLAVQRGVGGQKAELVVLKVLRPEVVEDEHVQALFTDEARIAMRLSHPNVIRTREVIAEPPDYVLAMDFQNGKSLLDVVSRLGRQAVPLDEHIYILSKVLDGLSYAHELKDEKGQPFGVVHRDVSPANVLVSYAGEVKLLDFGIAKATGALAATRDGVVKGKLGYAAPEQCLGQPADPRSDIYAVGVMLWEAIAGKRRASGETWQSVLQARVEDAEPDLEEVCPEAPRALIDIVGKALAREPKNRYSSAREFQTDLKKYLSSKGGTPVGSSRIAAMMKPHFDRDRAELHKSVEAFLNSLKANKAAKVGRIPLPGKAAAPAPAVQQAASPAQPAEREEHTAPIPVDTALLMLSRGETGPVPEESSRPTAPPEAKSTPERESPAPPPVSQVTTTPPPASTAITAPPPENAATTAPPPGDNGTSTPPQSAVTTARPPPDAVFPNAARPSLEPASPAVANATPAEIARATLPTPPKSPHLATDAFGLVSVAQAAPSHYQSVVQAVPQRKAPVWALLLVAAGVIGLGAVFLVPRLSAKQSAEPSPAPANPAVPATAPAAPAEAKVETVNVRISVDPADAVVKLDNVVLEGNPFVGAIAKDKATHELTAVAEGCKDHKQSVSLSRDVHLLVAMKCFNNAIRAKARAAGPRSVGAAPAAAAPARTPTPAQPAAEPQPAAPAPPPALPKDPPGAPGEQKNEAEGKYGF